MHEQQWPSPCQAGHQLRVTDLNVGPCAGCPVHHRSGKQLSELVRTAGRNSVIGRAIAVAHPHQRTAAAFNHWTLQWQTDSRLRVHGIALCRVGVPLTPVTQPTDKASETSRGLPLQRTDQRDQLTPSSHCRDLPHVSHWRGQHLHACGSTPVSG
jgi:hypothetical protein